MFGALRFDEGGSIPPDLLPVLRGEVFVRREDVGVRDEWGGLQLLKSQLEGLVCTEIVKGECSVLVVRCL